MKERQMNNLFKLLGVPALLSVSGIAGAAISEQTTVTFANAPTSGIFGKSNAIVGNINSNGSNCAEASCYVENGVVISTVLDGTSAGAHLHVVGASPAARRLHTHGDAGGVYIRLTDGSAFSFESIRIASSYSEDLDNVFTKFLANGDPNPDWNSAIDNFVIKGFSNASNPDLWQNNHPTPVAETSVFIGTNTGAGSFNVLAANPDFANVNAVWIYAGGRYNAELAGQRNFDVKFDDIKLNAPVAAAVPLPGAVWLFGSAVMGFLARSKRQNQLTA
jgi:hypothetical protein